MAFDQFDNAARAVRLGVARSIRSRRFTPARAAEAIEWLTSTLSVEERCRTYSERLKAKNAISTTCDRIEEVAGWTKPAAGASRNGPGSRLSGP